MKKKPKLGDIITIDYVQWCVKELFIASDVRWVFLQDKKENNKYLTEFEVIKIKSLNKR